MAMDGSESEHFGRELLQLSLAVVTRRGLSGMRKQNVLVSQVVPA